MRFDRCENAVQLPFSILISKVIKNGNEDKMWKYVVPISQKEALDQKTSCCSGYLREKCKTTHHEPVREEMIQ